MGDCLDNGGLWMNSHFHFDNLGQAILTLFYVTALDGWVTIMYQTTAGKGFDMEPETDADIGACVFFVVFIVVANFCVLNLFIGVIVDCFNSSASGMMATDTSTSAEDEKQEEIERQEIERINAVESLFYLDYPHNGIQRFLYHLVINPRFEQAITGVILLCILSMALEYKGQDQKMR